VRQALIVLLPTSEEIPDRYVDERTIHSYDVIKLWEVEASVLLPYEGLLPLATLCRAESGETLLTQVAARAKRIKSRTRQRDVLNASRVFAGLRYDKSLVNRILRESDMLEQSVIYQDIMQRGIPVGELKVVLMILEHRFGKLTRPLRKQIETLPVTQVEALAKTSHKLTSKGDLRKWLKQATR
jgi:predicted transposase YdaD